MSSFTGRLQAKDKAEEKVRGFIDRPTREFAVNDDELTKLLIDRYNAAGLEVRLMCLTLGEEIPLNNAKLGEAVRRLVDAELELATKWEERLALLEGHLAFLKEAENVTREGHKNNVRGIALIDVVRAVYFRRDGEIRLLKAKREQAAMKPAEPMGKTR